MSLSRLNFPIPTLEQWTAQVKAETAADFDRLWFTHESGATYRPLYTAEDKTETLDLSWPSQCFVTSEVSSSANDFEIKNRMALGAQAVLKPSSIDEAVDLYTKSTNQKRTLKRCKLSYYHNRGAHQSLEVALAEHFLNQETEPFLFDVSVTPEIFLEIAKLRALRSLIGKREVYILVRNSCRQMSQLDSWLNVLRGCTGVFSGVLGGADYVLAEPHNSISNNDAGSHRLDPQAIETAIHLGLVLTEEAQLAREKDPLNGSWAVENLTQELLKKGRELFVELGNNISDGQLLKQKITASVDKKLEKLATRRDSLIGVNEFPNLIDSRDQLSETKKVQSKKNKSRLHIPLNLSPLRWSEGFEKLRASALSHEKTHKEPLTVYIVSLGNTASFAQRLTWLQSYLEVGGIQSVLVEQSIARDKLAQSKVGILCGTDDDFQKILDGRSPLDFSAEWILLLAGNPGTQVESWKKIGVRDFLFVGTNVIDKLRQLHSWMGVKA